MEVQDEMIRITVLIAGRPYPLKIHAKEEPVVRRLVKALNDRVIQFQQIYKKDKQDLLAMTLLTYAMDLHKAQSSKAQSSKTSNIPITQLTNSIQEVDDLLESILDKKMIED